MQFFVNFVYVKIKRKKYFESNQLLASDGSLHWVGTCNLPVLEGTGCGMPSTRPQPCSTVTPQSGGARGQLPGWGGRDMRQQADTVCINQIHLVVNNIKGRTPADCAGADRPKHKHGYFPAASNLVNKLTTIWLSFNLEFEWPEWNFGVPLCL